MKGSLAIQELFKNNLVYKPYVCIGLPARAKKEKEKNG